MAYRYYVSRTIYSVYNELADKQRAERGTIMKYIANIAVGICAGTVVCWAVIHRRAIIATVKGEPLPQQPSWHPGHGCCCKKES